MLPTMTQSLVQSPSEQRQEIARWLASEDASNAPLEVVLEAVAAIDGDAIGFAEDHASDKQEQFQHAFETRKDDGRRVDIFAAMGANRSGKTIAGCWMCFAKHLRDRAQAGDVYWCIAPTLDRSIAGQQKELWKSLPKWMFGEETYQAKIGFGGHRKIVLENNEGGKFVVEFHSADQDATVFEQEAVSGIWIDESCPESVYDRLLARIIDRRGFIIITDIYEQFWYMERLKEADPTAGVYFQVLTMYDNSGNLPEGEIETAKARMTADEQKLRIYGELTVMEGIVFKTYRDDHHAINPFKIPSHWPRWRYIDYGGSSPTACGWIAIGDNEKAYIYREHYEKGRTILANAKMIHAASDAECVEVKRSSDSKHEQDWTQLVAKGGETYIATFLDPHAWDKAPGHGVSLAQQFEDAGIPCQPWPFVQKMGEHAMIERIKRRFECDMLSVFKSCTAHRREFRVWKHKFDKDGKPDPSDAYEKGNNHLIDGLKGFFGTNPVFTIPKIRVH
jgi:hypothetical protein